MREVATVCLVVLVSVAQGKRFPRTFKEWTPDSLVNPEELSGDFEGDINLPLPTRVGRSGRLNEKYRWPGGKAPYEIAPGFSDKELELLNRAIKEYETRTNGCVTFVEHKDEPDYIQFTPRKEGCSSTVGRKGGMQSIHLASKCFLRFGTVVHEMLHALGFFHEQSRPDRDDYVDIMWENISIGHTRNFNQYTRSDVSVFGVGYDYDSVMHYSAFTFSANQNKTIMTKDPQATIGQRERLSEGDVRKLMNMYKC